VLLILIINGPIQLLFENQYCENECPCPFCLVLRHVIGTQKSYFKILTFICQYAALKENIIPFLMVCLSCFEVYHNLPLRSPRNFQKIVLSCDCPCDDLVEVETPPRSVMALSYIAQALVVTIVGLNMGFRWCVGVSYMRGAGGEGATGTELRLKIILP
jgi:hypothetical protein